jgi:hypothetical protein
VHAPRLEPHHVDGHAADEDHQNEQEEREQNDRPVLVAPELAHQRAKHGAAPGPPGLAVAGRHGLAGRI